MRFRGICRRCRARRYFRRASFYIRNLRSPEHRPLAVRLEQACVAYLIEPTDQRLGVIRDALQETENFLF